MHVCMNISTWVCMIYGKVAVCLKIAVCMCTFNLLTEDVVLSQEVDETSEVFTVAAWLSIDSQTWT